MIFDKNSLNFGALYKIKDTSKNFWYFTYDKNWIFPFDKLLEQNQVGVFMLLDIDLSCASSFNGPLCFLLTEKLTKCFHDGFLEDIELVK